MKKFAVSFKGGLSRGFGAIGFLRFLQEEGLQPDIYAGASAGGVAAAGAAMGMSWQELVGLISPVKFQQLISLRSMLSEGSIVDKEKIRRAFLNTPKLNAHIRIEDLPHKLVLFASDHRRQKRVFITKGKLIDAVLTSIAFPIVFPQPAGEFLEMTDGDITRSYSAAKLRSLGVEVVFGVGYVGRKKQSKSQEPKRFHLANTLLDILHLMELEIDELNDKLDPPDFELEYFADQSYIDFNINQLVEKVYHMSRNHRDEILKLLD